MDGIIHAIDTLYLPETLDDQWRKIGIEAFLGGVVFERGERTKPFVDLMDDPKVNKAVTNFMSTKRLEENEARGERREAVLFVRQSAMVRAWAGLEALAQDLWVEAINRGSRPFRDRCFDEAGGKSVRIEDLKRHNFDMSQRLGFHLSSEFSFKRVEGISHAYQQAFGWTKMAPYFTYYHRLTKVEQARHCIVHRGGLADEEYLRKADRKNLKLGDQIGFDLREVGDALEVIGFESLNLGLQVSNMLKQHDPDGLPT